jgi:mycothiol synthase
MQVQELTTLSIRPFTADDYSSIARLHSVNFPEFSMDADEWRYEDDHRPAYCRAARYVAEHDGQLVAFAHYDQSAHSYDPRKFEVNVVVEPTLFLRGVGRRLFDLVLEEVQAMQPLSVDAWSRSDMTCRVSFLQRRGFVEDMRLWTSALDLTSFDSSRFAHVVPAVEAQGIQIRTLAELETTDPAVHDKLFELWLEVRRDVPRPPNDQQVDVPFERYMERFSRPHHLSSALFIALDGEQFVGISDLWLCPEPDVLRTGLTAVRRAYRRRGIALALKVRALQFGKAGGYMCVQTENESNNRGMLAINDELGFVKNPAWVHYFKSFEA